MPDRSDAAHALHASRRGFLVGGAALSLGTGAGSAAPADDVAADLKRYIDFGGKASGGPGDDACGEWLIRELTAAGYATQRQSFSAPFFEPARAELRCGTANAPVWPQPIVVPTGPAGASGPLVRIDPYGQPAGALAGAVALLDLPAARWSSTASPAIRGPVNAAFTAGARAVVIVTNGPTGQAIALNADGHTPMFAGPVGVLAPADAKPFLAAADRRAAATLTVDGRGGRRPAFNLIGRIDRGASRWLVISTPRSGWFGCAGERGSGVAVWLSLARWAAQAVPGHNLAFLCNSGHEYEYLGAHEALKTIAPKPADTHFWLHLGAAVAARDWHELPRGWRPLPGIDSQRCLSVSPALLPLAREVFAGHVGYEAPYASDDVAAGEITEIVAAGYANAAGVFGSHRFHHVAADDARCVSAAGVATTATAFRRFVERVAGRR